MTKQDKVAKVMHEWKAGTLTSNGKQVTDYDQAVAIALSEAGLSKYAKGGWVLYDEDDERLIKVYETESEARKNLYEYEGNANIVEKSSWDNNQYAEGGGIKSDKMKVNITKNEFQTRKDDPNRVFHWYEGNVGDYSFTAETDSNGINGINKGSIYNLYISKVGGSNIARYDRKWEYKSRSSKDGIIISEIIEYIDSISDKKDGEPKYKDMNEYSKGGNIIERRYVNKGEYYETRYAKNRPSRMGYKDERKFEGGGSITDRKTELIENWIKPFSWGKVDENSNVVKVMAKKYDLGVVTVAGLFNEHSKKRGDRMDTFALGGGIDGWKGSIFNKYFTTEEAESMIDTLEDNDELNSIDVGYMGEQGLTISVINVYTDRTTSQNPYNLEMGSNARGRFFIIPLKPMQEMPKQVSDKFAVGGEIGNTVTFSRYGERTTGRVTDKLRNGYEVVTDEGTILVEPQEVISFSDEPIAKKKRFGFFEGGGSVESLLEQRKELLEELINSDIIDEEHGYYDDVRNAIKSNDSEQMREIIDELLSSGLIYKDDWDYRLARKLSKEGRKFEGGGDIKNEPKLGDLITNYGKYGSSIIEIDEKFVYWLDNYASKNHCEKSDLVLNNLDDDGDDDGYYEGERNNWICKKKYAGGGEIENKIEKLKKVVSSKMLPESVKAKAQAEIDKLEKELHESKETKAEEKEEHKAGGSESKEDLIEIAKKMATERGLRPTNVIDELDAITTISSIMANESGFRHAKVDDLGNNEYTIEISPSTEENKQAGMVLNKFKDGTYEVAEMQAGKDGNFIKVFGEYKNLKPAVAKLLKGNKQKPMKVIDMRSPSEIKAEENKMTGESEGERKAGMDEEKDYIEAKTKALEKSLKDKTISETQRKRDEKELALFKGTEAKKPTTRKAPVRKAPVKKAVAKTKVDEIRDKVISFLNPLGYSATITDNKTEIYIEPSTKKVGKNRADFFDGMQIIYDVKTGGYEVSEQQAGKNEDELHIFKVTPSLALALKDLIKGNKRKAIKIWGGKDEEKDKAPSKPKADHKKLVAKLKAKKGDKEYSNRASLVPFTETRRKRNESSDRKREALPLGKRVSESGRTYYETRLNRGDISKEDKFEDGGEVKGSGWGLNLNW